VTPRLPRISGADAVKVFQKAGFTNARQKGSHDYLFKQGHPLALSVPQHKELAPGTLHALIKKVNLTVDQFTELL
jgi:predicted RNA binding protein YcfA (HicA-like mRNA interferase family)